MNKLENRAGGSVHDDGTQFTALITSHLMLKNGEKSSIITFVPKGVYFEHIVIGLNDGLCRTGGNVAYVQHEVSTLTKTKKVIPHAKFGIHTFAPKTKD